MTNRFFRHLGSLLILFLATVPLRAQVDTAAQRLGLPGDNLNLAAVLDVFRQSPTLEAFEASLNADTSKINNLDLNNDGRVDYIKVVDRPEENVHTIVLQIDVNAQETQDVAVIFVQKEGDDVKIQLVGDEELYGKNYILEPAQTNATTETPNPAYQGERTTVVTNNYYTENNYYDTRPSYAPPPNTWVIVHFIYTPVYRPWRSPWYWGYYPGWWNPWTPFYWDHYYHHWYYHHAWNGWWYWRAHHHHFDPWYGHYRVERRTSPVFTNYKRDGVYQRSYENPKPEARPAQRPRFPSHNLDVEKNPAIARPGSSARPIDMTPEKGRPDAVKPVQEVKPAVKGRDQQVQPTRPVGQPAGKPAVRPSEPVKKPAVKPTSPPRQPSAKPSQPAKQPTVRPAQPSKQPAARPAAPQKKPVPKKSGTLEPAKSKSTGK